VTSGAVLWNSVRRVAQWDASYWIRQNAAKRLYKTKVVHNYKFLVNV